jgi:hypothetical protein
MSKHSLVNETKKIRQLVVAFQNASKPAFV